MNKNKLSNFIKQIRGVSYKPTDLLEETDVGAVPILRANNIYNGCLNFDELVFVQSKRVGKDQYLRKGDILICASSGSKELVGKAAYVTEDLNMAFGAFCKVIRPNELNYSKYLGYFFQSDKYKHIISSSAQGANINNLRSEHIDELEVEIPQLNIIENSVNTLDHVSHLLSLRHQQLEKLDLLVKSRFVEMFGDPDINPNKWPTCLIQDIMSSPASNGFFTKPADYNENGNVAIVGVADVVNRRYSNVNNLRRANATDKDFKKFNVKYGDMLFCRSSLVKEGIAKASIIPPNCNNDLLFECHVIRIPLDLNKVIPEFAQEFSTTDYFRFQMMSKSKTATMTTISQKDIITGKLYLPPIEKQKEFLAFVHQVDKSKFAIKKSIEKLELLKNKLMQDYFG